MVNFCFVYKSKKKVDSYLYITEKDKFDDVPADLLNMFGQPIFVMAFSLAKRTRLGYADIQSVRQNLDQRGYYLQLPPPLHHSAVG